MTTISTKQRSAFILPARDLGSFPFYQRYRANHHAFRARRHSKMVTILEALIRETEAARFDASFAPQGGNTIV